MKRFALASAALVLIASAGCARQPTREESALKQELLATAILLDESLRYEFPQVILLRDGALVSQKRRLQVAFEACSPGAPLRSAVPQEIEAINLIQRQCDTPGFLYQSDTSRMLHFRKLCEVVAKGLRACAKMVPPSLS